MNEERKLAQKELDKKREAAEKRALGKGKGRGRGRGRGRKGKPVEPLEEQEPGKNQDEAASFMPEKSLQQLRGKFAHPHAEATSGYPVYMAFI